MFAKSENCSPPLRLARCSRALTILGALAALTASAHALPQWAEANFNTSSAEYPVDCTASPNNNFGAVRYASPSANNTILSVWKLDSPFTAGLAHIGSIGGGTLKSGNQTTVSFSNLLAYQPSDRIEITNTFGVSIGSGDGTNVNDETYVEFFDLVDSVGGTGVPVLRGQDVITSTSPGNYPYDHAGLANDLAITRDGDWAVVNSANWIHLYDVSNMPASIDFSTQVIPFNIGDIDYSTTPPTPGFNSPCSPNRAVDSVAVTNDRAVVTTARASGPNGSFRTWVYIIDLTTSPPTIVLQDELVPHVVWEPDEFGDRPHDVAITVARNADRFAVVTTTHGIAVFDLQNDVRLGSFLFDAALSRHYQVQVDSVELTDDRAVVVADRTVSPGITHWHVEVFNISSTLGLTSIQQFGPNGDDPPSRIHDLAIDSSLDNAVLRATGDNVVIQSLSTVTPVLTVVPTLNGSDVHEYINFTFSTNVPIFSSDSVVISPEESWTINGVTVTTRMAVTIGGIFDPTIPSWRGAVDIIDLNASTLSVIQVPITPNSTAQNGCIPTDLGIALNHDEVVVRSADPLPDVSPATGPDLVRILLHPTTPAITASYGGTGTTMGLDSLAMQGSGYLAAAVKRILSISQDDGVTAFGRDFTHRNK